MADGFIFSPAKAHALDALVGEGDHDVKNPRSARRSAVADKHYLFTLTGAISSGSGTATIRNMADDEEIATSQTVVDTLGFFDGLASGRRGICVRQAGVYYAIGPYVTDIRWDDPDLESSKDGGSNWDNIDTAEDC